MNPQDYHRSARHTIGGTMGDLPSYLFELAAADLRIYLLLGPDNCNAVIEARKLHDPQDGYCGNFNCDTTDDTLEGLKRRGLADPVVKGKSLFPPSLASPAYQMKKRNVYYEGDCDKELK